jgi:membrane protein DedA with SNARE-associated domain/rhodanese-related sulfurtransferase
MKGSPDVTIVPLSAAPTLSHAARNCQRPARAGLALCGYPPAQRSQALPTLDFLDQYALHVVAANTLLHELGAPVPLAPTLLVAGERAMSGKLNVAAAIAAVMVVTVVANAVWFAAGRRLGGRVLATLCRVSLSPNACVTRTESLVGRWGWATFVIGRFVPGVSLVAPPLAGASGMGWPRFVALDAAGAALWGAAMIGGGMLFHREIALTVAASADLGGALAGVVAVLVLAYAAYLWWTRLRERRANQIPRLSAAELRARIARGEAPTVIDVRGAVTRALDPVGIPGAIALSLEEIERGGGPAPGSDVVVFCACPAEVTAVRAARALQRFGHREVAVLAGGIDGWRRGGEGGAGGLPKTAAGD